MTERCERCGDPIEGEDLAYRLKRPAEGSTATFCSVNCVADTDEFDESEVRDRFREDLARARRA